MNWVKVSAVVIAVMLMLPGCSTTVPKQEPINKPPKYIVIEPSPVLLLPTKKAQPPNREEYLALDEANLIDWRKKERMLADAFIRQSGAVDQCNADKVSIQSHINQVKNKYQSNGN